MRWVGSLQATLVGVVVSFSIKHRGARKLSSQAELAQRVILASSMPPNLAGFLGKQNLVIKICNG